MKILSCSIPALFPDLAIWERYLVCDVFLWLDIGVYTRFSNFDHCLIIRADGLTGHIYSIPREEADKNVGNSLKALAYPTLRPYILDQLKSLKGNYAQCGNNYKEINDKVEFLMENCEKTIKSYDRLITLCEFNMDMMELFRSIFFAPEQMTRVEMASEVEEIGDKEDPLARIIKACHQFSCDTLLLSEKAQGSGLEPLVEGEGIQIIYQKFDPSASKHQYPQFQIPSDRFIPGASILDIWLQGITANRFLSHCSVLRSAILNDRYKEGVIT